MLGNACRRCGCKSFEGKWGNIPEGAVDPQTCECECHDTWKIVGGLPLPQRG